MLKHHGVWGVKPQDNGARKERGEGCEERAGENIPIYPYLGGIR